VNAIVTFGQLAQIAFFSFAAGALTAAVAIYLAVSAMEKRRREKAKKDAQKSVT
jgi:hypothetical protein